MLMELKSNEEVKNGKIKKKDVYFNRRFKCMALSKITPKNNFVMKIFIFINHFKRKDFIACEKCLRNGISCRHVTYQLYSL